MTPSLASVYDDLVARAAGDGLSEVVGACRAQFAQLGAFSPSDPWFEERSAALWDRVLCDDTVNAYLRESNREALGREHRAALEALSRAQRGLFEVHATAATRARAGARAEANTGHAPVDLVCAVTGAAFRIAPGDHIGTSLARSAGPAADDSVAPGLVDAHVVPTAEGVAVLPGLLLHQPEATEPIREIIAHARAIALPFANTLDALLSMRHKLGSLSRMKARQVYRPDALTAIVTPRAP